MERVAGREQLGARPLEQNSRSLEVPSQAGHRGCDRGAGKADRRRTPEIDIQRATPFHLFGRSVEVAEHRGQTGEMGGDRRLAGDVLDAVLEQPPAAVGRR